MEEGDEATVAEVEADLQRLERMVADLEFRRMFSGEMDASNAYLDIQAGSGGTEAQDWANILLRMYLRWADKRGFSAEIVELSEGEVAGIKGATVHIKGEYAFGWLRTEIGVHRLVRKSPFDSGARRHTSFSAVFVSPEIDDKVEIEINPADLRVDTYRSSGAGGQHVNKVFYIPVRAFARIRFDFSQLIAAGEYKGRLPLHGAGGIASKHREFAWQLTEVAACSSSVIASGMQGKEPQRERERAER